MQKRVATVFLVLLSAIVLVACGGGGGPCGASSQSFGVSFSPSSYSFKLGQEATITSTITPESCRGDISFQVRNGSLPPGMGILRGNIVGTPNLVGVYSFVVYITGVDGYQDVSGLSQPRSGTVTVTITP